MIDQKLVKNYALCLFKNVQTDLEHQKILEQISLFSEVLVNSEILRFALCSPIISKSDKLKIVNSFIKKCKLSELTSQFLRVVVKNSRFEILPFVVKQYKNLLDDSRGIKLVTVESVTGMPSKKVIGVIKEFLESKLNKIIEFNTVQNKSLIGGVTIKYDSLFYDYSISGTLDRAAKLAKGAKI